MSYNPALLSSPATDKAVFGNVEMMAATMQVRRLATDILTQRLSAFVLECMDEQGNPKAPSKKALMRARGALPARYPGTLLKNDSSSTP